MSREELQQTLNETTGFLERQRLLKKLWKLQREDDQGAVSPLSQTHETSRTYQRFASAQATQHS